MLFSMFLTLFFVSGSVVCDDLPCAARVGDNGQGYICVCNSTYCDTVESPKKLGQGLYYLFKTSNSTPGFTRTTGGFITSTVSKRNSTTEIVFIVNASTTYQEIIGIGGAIPDSTCSNINNLPDEAQDKLIESYFGPNGIEYNMLRVPIGGTDFSSRSYTLDDVPYDENLDSFSLAEEDFNLRVGRYRSMAPRRIVLRGLEYQTFTASWCTLSPTILTVHKIPLIKKAMSISQRDIRLLACTWAAPAWMKDTDTNTPGYISEKYNDVWARYHLKFLEEFQKQGLKVWSLSGGNEGLIEVFLLAIYSNPTLNSTLLFSPIQRSWFKSYLRPYLASSNFSEVKLITMEDQRVFAPYWMERIARDAEAYNAIDGIALHWYTDFFIPTSIMDDLHNDHPDKLILYTETSINGRFGPDVVSLGSWYRASGYLYNIFENIEKWTNVYLDWNLALDLDGGPTLSFAIDAPVIVNKTSGEFYKQPMFYALGHVSKFIPPGAVRVQVISNQNDTTVKDEKHKSRKSRNDELRDLLLSAKPHSLRDLPPNVKNVTVPQVVRCLATSNPDDSFTVLVLNTKNETAKVIVEDSRVGQISLTVEENSINTFVYWP